MLQFVLKIIFWCHLANGAANVNWNFSSKLLTIKNSLIYTKNLEKFSDIQIQSDNFPRFNSKDDEYKVKRSYDNDKCIEELEWIQENINNPQNGWAFELFETWGSLPSEDTVIDHGNFENCRKMKPMTLDSYNIHSQYCFLDIAITPLREIQTSWNTNQMGICIPDSCAPTLIKSIMNEYLNTTNSNSFGLNIATELCYLKGDNEQLFLRDQLMIGFIAAVFLLVILGTIYEAIYNCHKVKGSTSRILLAFSAISNGKALFSCRKSEAPNVFHFFHGIRVISCCWIMYGHFIANFKVSKNYNDFIEFKSNSFKHSSGGTPLSVDTFLVLSGILTSISIQKRLSQPNNQMSFLSLIFQRFWRWFPVLAFVAFFQLTLFKFFVFGPIYREVDYLGYGCRNDLWKTLLFVNNYLDNNCVVVSWYTSVDMQLYIFAPFLLSIVQRSGKRMVAISILLILIDFIALSNEWGLWNKSIDGSYYFTYYRFPAWLIGLNVGYVLDKYHYQKVSIRKYLNTSGLIGSLILMVVLIYFYYFVSLVQMWLFRIVWSLALSYIIFTCVYKGGKINSFLSLPVWQPLSRLSFVTFLISRLVIVATSQNAHIFSKTAFFQYFLLIFGVANAVAVVISLMIEMPLAKLKPKPFVSDCDLK